MFKLLLAIGRPSMDKLTKENCEFAHRKNGVLYDNGMIFRGNWCMDAMSRLLKRTAHDETCDRMHASRCLHKCLPILNK